MATTKPHTDPDTICNNEKITHTKHTSEQLTNPR